MMMSEAYLILYYAIFLYYCESFAHIFAARFFRIIFSFFSNSGNRNDLWEE